jgi:hypothetical protein
VQLSYKCAISALLCFENNIADRLLKNTHHFPLAKFLVGTALSEILDGLF